MNFSITTNYFSGSPYTITIYLIIEFKNDPLIYLDLEDHSRENVIKEQHKINVYLNKIRQGLI